MVWSMKLIRKCLSDSLSPVCLPALLCSWLLDPLLGSELLPPPPPAPAPAPAAPTPGGIGSPDFLASLVALSAS